MKISKKIILFWFVLFVPFLGYKLYNRYKENEDYKERYTSTRKWYVGGKFLLDNFKDSSGHLTKIDTKKSPITIIDFWYNSCPPCIADMKSFSPILKKLGSQVSVVSISVNNFSLWHSLLNSKDQQFDMFLHLPNNWKHLVLNSNESEKLHNDVPADNIETIQNAFQTTNFPMYFVLDTAKTIIAAPFSLSEYLTVDLLKKQNRFTYFLTQRETWNTDYWFIPLAFVQFSGFYWIGINMLFLLTYLRKKNYS